MQWFTHKAAALAGAVAAGAPVVGLAGALIGSVLPDMVDRVLSAGDRRRWRQMHRQSSHWFGWYIIIVFAGVWLSSPGLSDPGSTAAVNAALKDFAREFGLAADLDIREMGSRLLGDLVLWIGLGGLCHILLDGLTPMGVPLFPLGGRRRVGLKLVSTGSFGERLFLVAALAFAAIHFEEVRQLLTSLAGG